jgi:hypothetical protein
MAAADSRRSVKHEQIACEWSGHLFQRAILVLNRLMPDSIRLRGCSLSHRVAAGSADAYHSHTIIDTREVFMIAVMVRFQFENEFNEARLQQIADGARSKFQGMPGVRSKAFTLDAARRQALNFYVWESEDAARKFFSPQMIEGVAKLYGVRPSIEYLKLVALVENPPTQ